MNRLLAALVASATLVVCTLFATGCSPYVVSLTHAPPMRVAQVDSSDDTIRLSEGVAMAFDCRDGSSHRPCESFRVESRDPGIAGVHLAHVEPEHGAWAWARDEAPSSFVLVGIKPGATVVTARSGKWSRSYTVTVVGAPLPIAGRSRL